MWFEYFIYGNTIVVMFLLGMWFGWDFNDIYRKYKKRKKQLKKLIRDDRG
jgi:hypothetical protein